jgi:hypothetical protein
MVDLERQLATSIAHERRLRARLTELERDAVALRESRSTLLNDHAAERASVRADLNMAVRTATLIRERQRAAREKASR